MDSPTAQSATVTIEHYRHRDLTAAMLRQSFRRGGRKFYVKPLTSIVLALLTAGLWPTGLLIARLWMYASFQRFRAGELARWLRVPAPAGLLSNRDHYGPTSDFQWFELRSTQNFVIAWMLWVPAGFVALSLAVDLASMFDLAPTIYFTPKLRLQAFTWLAALSSTASFASMLITYSLRSRVHSFVHRPDMHRLQIMSRRINPDFPIWCVWPLALLSVVIPLKLAGFRVGALWIVASACALLAAEVQRGYIIVADRRLRVCVARAIGRIMYGPGVRR